MNSGSGRHATCSDARGEGADLVGAAGGRADVAALAVLARRDDGAVADDEAPLARDRARLGDEHERRRVVA
jgi:hypothetical protein